MSMTELITRHWRNMEIPIEYKEAKDFEKSAFVVSLKDFRDLENRYKKAIELAFASDALPSEKILRENQNLREDLGEAISIAEDLFVLGGYAYNPEGRIKELKEKYGKKYEQLD